MRVNRTKIFELIQANKEVDLVLVKGWIKTIRNSKNFSFLEVNDGSSLKNLQIIVDEFLSNYEEIKKISIGSAIYVYGSLIKSRGSNQKWELKANEISVIGTADTTFPLQKKRHSDEFLRTIAHLRPRTNKYGAMFRIRSKLSWAIHDFFRNRSFHYIHTPIITSSDCEGAGSTFKVSKSDFRTKPKQKFRTRISDGFFESEANLTVSGQLSAEMLALSLGDVYSFGPTFRAENSNTSRHIAEFWMVEPEMAFCNIEKNMKFAEEFIKYLVNFVMVKCNDDFELFCNFVDRSLKKAMDDILTLKFVRIEYREAIEILAGAKKNFKFKVIFGSDLQSEHERYLVEEYFERPVIVYNYPKKIKPFYMRVNDDEQTVAAMDVLVPRVGEIIGGSQREERLDFLLKRMSEHSICKDKYWWYVDSRRYGSVEHSGFGMGFERFLMLVTGVRNIRDVIPFPRTPGTIEF